MEKCRLLILLAISGVVSNMPTARAAMVVVAIDGVGTDVPVHWQSDGGNNGLGAYAIGAEGQDHFQWSTVDTVDGGVVDLQGELDADPSLIFAGTAIDFGAPSSFTFTFILPLSPLVSNPSTVLDSFSGSVTNGSAAGGVTLTALAPPAGIPTDTDGIVEMQVFSLSSNGGATWQNVGLDLGPSQFFPLPPFGSGTYGPFNEGPIATIPGGPWTHMRADINFRLSGGSDTFTFNGAKSIEAIVPEPISLLPFVLSSLLFWRLHRIWPVIV